MAHLSFVLGLALAVEIVDVEVVGHEIEVAVEVGYVVADVADVVGRIFVVGIVDIDDIGSSDS